MGIGVIRPTKWSNHVVVVKLYDGIGNLAATRGYLTKGEGFNGDGTLAVRWSITSLGGLGYLLRVESQKGEKIAEDVVITPQFLTQAVVEGGRVDDSEITDLSTNTAETLENGGSSIRMESVPRDSIPADV